MRHRAVVAFLPVALMSALVATHATTAAQEDVIRVEPAKLTPAKKVALDWVDLNKNALAAWSDRIWGYAELSLQEFQSSALLADALEKAGFKVTRGVSDMPTAFVAEYGSGPPVIGILAEYDALPGLSQQAVARQEPVQKGGPGHGCGHNVFGVGSVGAALAIKQAMEKEKIPGTLRLYGTPAEENYSAKTYMARDRWFDGLSAALHWHPDGSTGVELRSSTALNGVEIEFFGKAAHAGGSPWEGRSALDAVELLNSAMNYLREHVKPSARIHYVITNGGAAANIVPDYAKVWYMIRDQERQGVDYLHQRLLDSAKGASLMTQTTFKVNILEGVWNILVNEAGGKLAYANLLMVGPPRFTEEEQAFAKAIQKQMGLPEKGMSAEIDPLRRPQAGAEGGSTDVADVSWLTPTIGFGVALAPAGTPGHDWSTVACGGMSIGHKSLEVAAKTLASTGLDLLQDPRVLSQMTAEWKEKTKGVKYKSALPEGQKPPLFRKPG